MFVFCSPLLISPRLHPGCSCCASNFVLLLYLFKDKSIMKLLNGSFLLFSSENYSKPICVNFL